MAQLLDLVKSPSTYLVAILIFSVLPKLVLQLMVKIYPKGHPRRKELLAECAFIKRRVRPFWVAENVVTALFDGVPVRIRQLKKARRRRAARALNERGLFNQFVKSHGSRIGWVLFAIWIAGGTASSLATLSDPNSVNIVIPASPAPFTAPLVPTDAATCARIVLMMVAISLICATCIVALAIRKGASRS